MNKLTYIYCLSAGLIIGYFLGQLTSNNDVEKMSVNKTLENSSLFANQDFVEKQTKDITKEDQAGPKHKRENGQSKSVEKNIPSNHLATNTNQLDDSQQAQQTPYQELETRYLQNLNKLTSLEQRIDRLEPSEIKDNQLKSIIPEPFSEIATNFTGPIRDDINNFHQMEEDHDWGYQTAMQIADFIHIHSLSYDILVNSISCKANICEILITSQQPNSWNTMVNDMRSQTWWRFSNTSSSSSSNTDPQGNLIIYNFFRQ